MRIDLVRRLKNLWKNLAPLGNNVIVKPTAAEEVRKSGIIIPDTAKEKPQEGEIIAAGPGKTTKTGTVLTHVGQSGGPGDLRPSTTGSEMKIDGEKYLIMPESDILGDQTGRRGLLRLRGKKVKWPNR